MRYLANKHNLMGSTPEEKARCDMLTDGANELFDYWVAALWSKEYVSLRNCVKKIYFIPRSQENKLTWQLLL